MDINTFYAVTAGLCFTLVGLWWNVVSARPNWIKDETTRQFSTGIYMSFLLPGLMSLASQLGGDSKFIWQGVFAVSSGVGLYFTWQIMQKTRGANPRGNMTRNRWIVLVLYAVVLLYALVPSLASIFGLHPLQFEGFMLCFIILSGHALAWELLTDPSGV